MKRRDVLELTVLSAAAASAPAQEHQHGTASATPAATAPVFHTKNEFALLDQLTELIIPTDAHSPGAREAKVAAYIDQLLTEASAQEQTNWRRDLAAVDAEAREQHRKPFLECSAAEQDLVMKKMAEGEMNPKTDLHRFFVRLKSRTQSGYYTSSIGLLRDLQYKGIVPIAAFPPCNHPDHHRPANKK